MGGPCLLASGWGRSILFDWGRMIRQIAALVVAVGVLTGCSPLSPDASTTRPSVIANAYEEQLSGVQVTGAGTVTRVLADDSDGGRHQRFILELDSGQTLLVAHNIDVAPRVPTLFKGDHVEFSGVYEWNAEGGVVHWTHHDPDGTHEAGWLKHDGTLYQ